MSFDNHIETPTKPNHFEHILENDLEIFVIISYRNYACYRTTKSRRSTLAR
jgi:hypothetical protein